MKIPRGFAFPVVLALVALLALVGAGGYWYTNQKQETRSVVSLQHTAPNSDIGNPEGHRSGSVLSEEDWQSTAATSSMFPGMSRYVDKDFGFSFWYPSSWSVNAITSEPFGYSGATYKKTLIVIGSQSQEVDILIFDSPDKTITDRSGVGPCPVCNPVRYYFDSNQHTWMVDYPEGNINPAVVPAAANVSRNTMGGLHILAGSQRFGANVIVPLSAHRFLVVVAGGLIASESSDPQALARTIVAADASVGTPVSEAQQRATIQAVLTAYQNVHGSAPGQ